MLARVVAPVSLLLLLALQAGGLPTLHAGTLQAQLVASDGAAGDNFGSSVDIDGGTLVVGAPGDDIGANVDQGSAYVFVRVGGMWTEQAKLVASDGANGDSFGASVSVSGDTVLIGAPSRNVSPSQFAGGAYVFVRTGGIWTLQQTLTPCAAASCRAGASVALDGDRALIGAPGLAPFGGAHIFERAGGVWTLQATLLGQQPSPSFPEFPAPPHQFGRSVGLAGDWALVGSNNPFIDVNVGRAYLFRRTGPSSWPFHSFLGPGTDVAISNDRAAAIFALFPSFDRLTGFSSRSGTSWNPDTHVATPGAQSLATHGDIVVVGSGARSAHLFQRGPSSWTALPSLLDNAPLESTGFGKSVALHNGTAAVGLPGKDFVASVDQGAVQVFTELAGPPAPPPSGPPPTITPIPDQTVLVNQVVGPLSFTIDGRIIADALNVTAFTSDPTLVAPSSIVLGRISGAVRTVTLRPADGRIGTATITLSVSDGFFSTTTDFRVNVVATLPPPPPLPPALPGAPRDVVATLSGSGIDLTWREPVTGPVRRYAIAGGRSAGESILPVQVTRDGALSARLDGLPPTTYSLRVYAIGTNGIGPPSSDVVITVPNLGGPVLAPLFGLRVIEQTGRRVTVTWESPVVGVATSTRVDLGATLEGIAPITTVLNGPIGGDLPAPLWVQVRAVNGSTTSAPSQPLHITFDAPCTAPPGPPIVLPTSFLAGLGTFAWLPAEGAMASRYRVEITPLVGPARVFDAFGGSSLVLPVTPGGFGSLRVFAINACGETGSS